MEVENMKKIIGIFVVCVALALLLPQVYSTEEADDCEPEIYLPDYPITMYTWEFPDDMICSYKIELKDINEDYYDVDNGIYKGWCIEFGKAIPHDHNVALPVKLISSYGDLPDYLDTEDWIEVNYIINHPKGNARDIQRAIWYFINLGPWDWDDTTHYSGMSQPVAQATLDMIDDAKDYADDWCPECGDVIAVICEPHAQDHEDDFQITFIEVKLVCGGCTYTPGYWKNHAVGKHADPTWEELSNGPDTIFFDNAHDLTWLSVMSFNAKQAKEEGLIWTDVQVYQHLAFHYVAAVLNYHLNDDLPPGIEGYIDDAAEIFEAYPDMKIIGDDIEEAKSISTHLAEFNEGYLPGWPHCSD